MAMFEIKHKLTGIILFSLETGSLKLCLEAAVKAKTNLDGASLDGASLVGASLVGASLVGAYLNRASLDGAYLNRASLVGASLVGASLNGAVGIFHLGSPNGWHAHAWLRDGWLSIRVGCHEFRLSEARDYWRGKDDRREVMAALDYAEAVAKVRGWQIAEPAKIEAA